MKFQVTNDYIYKYFRFEEALKEAERADELIKKTAEESGDALERYDLPKDWLLRRVTIVFEY